MVAQPNQKFNIPEVVKNWVHELRNKDVPVWIRDNTAIRLAELSEMIDKEIKNFETSIFDGNYVCGSVTKEYLTNLESERKDSNKSFN